MCILMYVKTQVKSKEQYVNTDNEFVGVNI